MMWNGYGMGPGMWLLWLLVLAGVVVLVVVLVRLASGGGTSSGGGSGHGGTTSGPPAGGVSRARAILEERYARGEIDSTEFQERLGNLDGQ
nr:SHOCT domain-containing protein [Cellulomonas sp. KRMCY2]